MAYGKADPKLDLVRRLITTAPDAAFRKLAEAFEEVSEAGLATVADLVREEAEERELRTAVLKPVLGTGSGVTAPVPRFSAARLGLVWTALRRREPAMTARARISFETWDPYDPVPMVFDDLCLAAAEAVRAEPDLAAALDRGAALALAAAPLVRQALLKSHEWIDRPVTDAAAALRLILKDAAALAEDGLPGFLNLLATHLRDPKLVFRLVCAALERPSDGYLAVSELAGFGEALLTEIAGELDRVKAFDPALGPDAARTAAVDVQRACDRIRAFEAGVELNPEGPWGKRVSQFRRALAASVEGRLRDVEGAVVAALPVQKSRVSIRMSRSGPKLDAPVDAQRVERARTLMVYMNGVRLSGAAGGFGSLRAKTVERIAERLTAYADETLTAVNVSEAADEAVALERVALAAEFLELAEDPQGAAVIRRRMSVAGSRGPSRGVG